MEITFKSSTGADLSIARVVEETISFMKEDPRRLYRVTIGTDSELLATKEADFVTAVVVHRVGNGGRYFWRRFTIGRFHTLRDRIIQEVLISLDAAKAILTALKVAAAEESSEMPEWEFEVHADIGEYGETKVMLQEVVGMIRAHNFEARVKPLSYAASNVADRHTS
ncbi:MAG: ribonuclease H-like YkuK family protein [Candidatus Liptonbacteria bacterium]|nr:ribonuclease H-like YkuK family protein [Candidatus Liptonbacteria bacterium]